MYIHVDDLWDVLHKYFLHRCRNSVLFSLQVTTLLRDGSSSWLALLVLLYCSRPHSQIHVQRLVCIYMCMYMYVYVCCYTPSRLTPSPLPPSHPPTLTQMAWLLSASTTGDHWLPSAELQRGNRLLYLIRTEQVRAPPLARSTAPSPSPQQLQQLAPPPSSSSSSNAGMERLRSGSMAVLSHHHRSLSGGGGGFPHSSSTSKLSALDRRKGGSTMVRSFVSPLSLSPFLSLAVLLQIYIYICISLSIYMCIYTVHHLSFCPCLSLSTSTYEIFFWVGHFVPHVMYTMSCIMCYSCRFGYSCECRY